MVTKRHEGVRGMKLKPIARIDDNGEIVNCMEEPGTQVIKNEIMQLNLTIGKACFLLDMCKSELQNTAFESTCWG